LKKNFDNKLKGTGTRKFSQRQHVIIEGLMDLYKPRKPHTVGFNINLSCGCKARYAEAKPSKGDLLFCRKHNDYRLAV